MGLIPFKGVAPRVADDAFVAKGARVIGDVTIGPGSGIWYNAVLRGDIAPITIGSGCNIQDNCTVHGDRNTAVVIGDDVSVGHGAVIHGCTIENGALIGIHALVLTGATVGAESIVGAGAVVSEGTVIPPRSLALGVPARVVRELREADLERGARTARNYASLAQQHKSGRG